MKRNLNDMNRSFYDEKRIRLWKGSFMMRREFDYGKRGHQTGVRTAESLLEPLSRGRSNPSWVPPALHKLSRGYLKPVSVIMEKELL